MLAAMGSTPAFLRHLLPRAGTVAPNAAIVLEGYVIQGDLQIAAQVGGLDIPLTVEQLPWFSYERYPTRGTLYLLRPRTGEWPHGATVTLAATNPGARLEVTIGTARDLAAPGFTSLGQPVVRTLRPPQGPLDVLAVDHGVFDDSATPIVLITLELATGKRVGAVPEGHAGMFAMRPSEEFGYVEAIVLADAAGNTHRIVAPAGPPAAAEAPFSCVAGSLEPIEGVPGAFVGLSDRSSAAGFSRGHYVTTRRFEGDVEIVVTAERLTDDHELPIEIAFRGGFFGVTGTSSWFLYEHDGNWTGWQTTPSPVGAGPLTLRVVQRGQTVSGYINEAPAGNLTLQKPAVAAGVGIHFKGRPGTEAKIRYRDFVARAVNVASEG